MQKRLNKPPCPSLWGCWVVFCNMVYSPVSRIVRSCFLLKEYSTKKHHHSVEVPIDMKDFLTESLYFFFPIFILLLPLISLNLSVSLLVLTLSDLKTFAMSWPFAQPSPSQYSTGCCWHGCSGHSVKRECYQTSATPVFLQPGDRSSFSFIGPLLPEVIPLSFKGHFLSFLWSTTGTVVCSVRLPKINQIGS